MTGGAKQVLYVVGHHAHWRTAGKFATAAHMLPVVRWPLYDLAEIRAGAALVRTGDIAPNPSLKAV